MNQLTTSTEAYRQYTVAHEAHYKEKDLEAALDLYRGVMAAHPDTQEAKFSRVQIGNIVSSVVPERELFDAKIDLALRYIDHRPQPAVEPDRVAPGAYDPVNQQK